MQMRQLEAFHAVMMCGTLTRAAASLFISQPSISRMLTDLEAELEFPLFDRKKGRVTPTPEGIVFFEELKKIYSGIDGLSDFAINIRNQRTGHIKISVSPALSLSFLPAVMAKFQKKFPDSIATISVRAPSHIYSELNSGTTDIAFCSALTKLPNVMAIPLVDAKCICALPPGHHLGRKKCITPEDISDEHFIMLKPEPDYFWAGHDQLMERMENKPQAVLYTQRSAIAYGLVSQGLGISILEPFSANHWAELGVIIKPFRPAITYPFTMFFPKEKIRSQLAQELANISIEYLADNPLPFQDDHA